MSKYLGTIRLNSGQGGWFDELTRIHLTLGNPQADVFAGQNLSNVRKGVHAGRLSLIKGTLGPDDSPYKVVRVGNHYELQKNKLTKTEAEKVAPAEKNAVEKNTVKEDKSKTDKVEEKNEAMTDAPVKEEFPAEETQPDVKEEKTALKKTARKGRKPAAKKAK